MARGESQECNWAANGWVRMTIFVCSSYSCKAALMIVSKIGEEVVLEAKAIVLVLGAPGVASRKGTLAHNHVH